MGLLSKSEGRFLLSTTSRDALSSHLRAIIMSNDDVMSPSVRNHLTVEINALGARTGGALRYLQAVIPIFAERPEIRCRPLGSCRLRGNVRFPRGRQIPR
jgi:hypothetical protein